MSPPRVSAAAAGGVLAVVQMVGPFGALVTGGAIVLLLCLAAVVLLLRPRPRGWVIGAGVLAGVGLFALPWSLFVAQQSRAAGSDAGAWSWIVAGVALLGLAASAWLLAQHGRAGLALARDHLRTPLGVLTAASCVGAVFVAVAVAMSGGSLGLAASFGVLAWVLLRTLRVAEPPRHLADVVVATALVACLLWWVFVGTLQGATGGVGMLATLVVVLLVLVVRAGRAADGVPATLPRPDAG